MKPILFNTEMIRAILSGKKTVTRRLVKEKRWKITGRPKWADESTWQKDGFFFNVCSDGEKEAAKIATCHLLRPPYIVGDILWVRETWAKDPFGDGYIYPTEVPGAGQKWRPSIHMPREAARIFLRVTDVRVERLKEITFRDIGREGVKWWEDSCEKWVKTWNGTIKPADLPAYGWDANPWVWVVSFERISKDEAQA